MATTLGDEPTLESTSLTSPTNANEQNSLGALNTQEGGPASTSTVSAAANGNNTIERPEGNSIDADAVSPSGATQDAQTTIAKTNTETGTEEEKQPGGGGCSSSSEHSESDNEHYDEEAQVVKFKVIDIKHTDPDGPIIRK